MPLAQQFDAPVDGVAFCDAAEVDTHTWLLERDRAVSRHQSNIAIVDQGQGTVDRRIAWLYSLAIVVTVPNGGEGDIECAFGQRGVFEGGFEQAEKLLRDNHRFACGHTVDEGEFTLLDIGLSFLSRRRNSSMTA